MRVLDLDMDYFMKCVAQGIGEEETKRLDDAIFKDSVWSEKSVINFLEGNLGLKTNNKVPGRIITGHNEALIFWYELIQMGDLITPFEVIHVDSHADLGLCFNNSDTFIMGELLKWPVIERPAHSYYSNHTGKKVTAGIGDYLLFAIAYRWIKSLTYCGNPNGDSADYDIYILKDFEDKYIDNEITKNTIQLLYNSNKKCPGIFEDKQIIREYIDTSVKEPEVPFTIIPTIEDVHFDGNYDFAVMAQSPNYTPANADFIMDLFKMYIYEI